MAISFGRDRTRLTDDDKRPGWLVRESAPLAGLIVCTIFFGCLLSFTPVLLVTPAVAIVIVCGLTVMFCFWMLSRFAR